MTKLRLFYFHFWDNEHVAHYTKINTICAPVKMSFFCSSNSTDLPKKMKLVKRLLLNFLNYVLIRAKSHKIFEMLCQPWHRYIFKSYINLQYRYKLFLLNAQKNQRLNFLRVSERKMIDPVISNPVKRRSEMTKVPENFKLLDVERRKIKNINPYFYNHDKLWRFVSRSVICYHLSLAL